MYGRTYIQRQDAGRRAVMADEIRAKQEVLAREIAGITGQEFHIRGELLRLIDWDIRRRVAVFEKVGGDPQDELITLTFDEIMTLPRDTSSNNALPS